MKESIQRIHGDSYSGTEARASTFSYESSIVKEEVMYMRCREGIKARMKDRQVMAATPATTEDQIPGDVNK